MAADSGIELPPLDQSHTSSFPATSTHSAAASSRGSTAGQILTQNEVDEKPWKYIGYKGYSEFISSESDFLIFRRFAAASARIALSLQYEVSMLEQELENLDRKYSKREAEDVHNGSFREEQRDRGVVLRELHDGLVKYNSFILQQAELKKYPTSKHQDIKSLENWHWNHNNCAIDPEEQKYLTHQHDLFSVVPREKTPLRRLLDRSRRFRIHSWWKDKKAPELPLYDKDVVTYISDKRIDRFITVVIVGVGVLMLIAPMWILQALQDIHQKLGTITAFIVLFLGMVSYATVAKPFETLAATAAYAAVLTVFLQFGTSSAPSG